MYEFCTNDLQAKLRKNREDEDKRFEEKMKSVSSTILSVENSSGMAMESPRMDSITDKTDDGIVVTNPLGESKEDMEVEDLEDEDAEALKAALSLSMSVEPSAIESTVSENGFAFGNGLPRNFTGLYELHSLVTHKGRSADSGHYIGWVRQAPGSTAWWQYNDDVVSEATTQDIMLLKGGGDRDMVYLAFYRYKESKN
jgi:ubiquitin carboxyl-terminal hydrolase 14